MNPSRVLAVTFVLLGTVLTSCNAAANTMEAVCNRLGLTYLNSTQACFFTFNPSSTSYSAKFQMCMSFSSGTYRGRMAQITTPGHLNIGATLSGALYFVGAHSLVNGSRNASQWGWFNDPFGQPVTPLTTSVANISFTGSDCMQFCTKPSAMYCNGLQLMSSTCVATVWPLCELYGVPKTIPQFKLYAKGKWVNQASFSSSAIYTGLMARSTVLQTNLTNVGSVHECAFNCYLQSCASLSYKQTTKQCFLHDMPASWLDQMEGRLVTDPNAEIWSYLP